ncbi:MAG: hypothetical protein JST39_01890 [Bacteroidetes bacterium]|nr:hypothetical protein [Bacteroidota bacterium]
MRLLPFAAAAVLLAGCGNRNIPDVSGIKVDVSIGRFDRDFFNADTVQTERAMVEVNKKYPYFFNDYIRNIVFADVADTTLTVEQTINQYKRNVRPIYDSVQKKFPRTTEIEEQLTQGFKFVKYYFPSYSVPKVVTYTGLIGDPSVALTSHALAIGLQMYLGKSFSAYNTLEAIDQFPQYISRRFEPQYIPVNCLQNIALDIYPDHSQGMNLIGQMIEKGKQWYLADKFMPTTADSLKTGYTQAQLDWAVNNEGLIWNFILQSNDLYNSEPTIVQRYIGESPKTDGMSDASPGNIGQWVGLQIIKAYVAKTGASVQQVLQTDAKKIFEEAAYKPK